jgi:cytoskeleton protein RodZ
MQPTLGQRLKLAREQRSLSLADVAHVTRIPALRLRELEEDHYNGFGNITYARSFLQIYAAFLDVDPHAIVDQMAPPPLGGRRDYRYLVETYGTWVRDRYEGARARAMRKPRPVASLAVVSVILIAIGGMLFATAWWGDRGKPAPLTKKSPPASEIPAKRPDALVSENGEFIQIRPALPTNVAPTPLNAPVKAKRAEDPTPVHAQPVVDAPAKK